MTTETIKVIVKENEPIQLSVIEDSPIQIGVDEKYLYIHTFDKLSRDWASKTDGKVKDPDTQAEIDYSARAYAIGGTGTETGNAKYYSEQAEDWARKSQEKVQSDWSETDSTKASFIKNKGDYVPTSRKINGQALTQDITIDALPSQTGQSGKFLTTNGTSASWGTVDALGNKMTNCLTEIPQTVKLELNNGTLTLKQGSKIYIPNGSGIFNETTVALDIEYSETLTASTHYLICAKENEIELKPLSNCVSGEQQTTTNGFNYDTEHNQIDAYGASLESPFWSLPVGIVETNGSGVITTTKQVFNGFGYIGSTVFSLPNIKGLITDGVNTDGTLKNTALNTTGCLIYTDENTSTGKYFLSLNNSSLTLSQTSGYCIVGDVVYLSGVVQELEAKTTFRAVDYSEADFVIETYRNGTSGYRVWKSGYCEQWGVGNFPQGYASCDTVNLLKTFKDTDYIGFATILTGGSFSSCIYIFKNGKTVNSFTPQKDSTSDSSYGGTYNWIVKGFIA